MIELHFNGHSVTTDVVIVSPLTAEAMLGLDFLQEHQVPIDLFNRQVWLADRGISLPLHAPSVPHAATGRIAVRAREKLEIQPWSEVEIIASIEQPGVQGTWLLEESTRKRPAASVARALVQVVSGQVPVRLLNARAETITVYAGSEIATLEQMEVPVESIQTVTSSYTSTVDEKKLEMLTSLANEVETSLSAVEREKFLSLLCSYADVFSSSTSDLGRTNKLKHSIDTGGAAPIRQSVRRLPPQRRNDVGRLIGEMLESGVVERSTSPWASPIVLVKKKDGTVRFCVDYRKVNNITRKDAYPLPRIDTTLDTLSGSQWFSTLDLLSGYWQVEVEEADRDKTAFCTTEGLFLIQGDTIWPQQCTSNFPEANGPHPGWTSMVSVPCVYR